ncbi:MAG: HypC/HybG/HupF family hydrogenase formation chaperone [Anaerolineae bacterium]
MCVAVPARVVEIGGQIARLELGGVTREASLMLLPEVKVGDYVIVHAGFAIERLDEKEAEKTLELLAELGTLELAGEETGEVHRRVQG